MGKLQTNLHHGTIAITFNGKHTHYRSIFVANYYCTSHYTTLHYKGLQQCHARINKKWIIYTLYMHTEQATKPQETETCWCSMSSLIRFYQY